MNPLNPITPSKTEALGDIFDKMIMDSIDEKWQAAIACYQDGDIQGFASIINETGPSSLRGKIELLQTPQFLAPGARKYLNEFADQLDTLSQSLANPNIDPGSIDLQFRTACTDLTTTQKKMDWKRH